MSLSAGECSPDFACPLQRTRSFADIDEPAKIGKHVSDIVNVTLYVKELNKWTAEDLQHPNNNISLLITHNRACLPLPMSYSLHLMVLLDGLDRKRELPRGDEVMLYAS